MPRNGSIHDLLDSTAPFPYSSTSTFDNDQINEEEPEQQQQFESRSKRREYAPINRISPPTTVLNPISKLELIQCETTINPLRLNLKSSNSKFYNNLDDDNFTSASTASNESNNKGKAPMYNNNDGNNNNNGLASLPNRPQTVKERLVDNYHSSHNNNKNHQQSSIQGKHQPRRNNQEDDPAYKRRRQNQDVFAVQSHYNARPNIDRNSRMNSPIIGLKNFNNWIKSVLIAKFGRREDNTLHSNQQQGGRLKVLDLGCGKGGDLQKWFKAGTDEYIGFDLAAVSVEQARSRWQEMHGEKFQAAFFALDCFEESISTILQPMHVERPFDVVSMQFCLHYAFESEPKARMMLSNVVKYLKLGGTLIATIPDAGNLLNRLEELNPSSDLTFGNEVYKISFDSQDTSPRFGHRYTFFLQDAVEEVPEYIVYWDMFTNLAEEYGLECSFKADFQMIFKEERNDKHFATLLSRMKVVDKNGDTEMNMDQWEACNLYVGVAFTKVFEIDLEALAMITELNAR